MKGDTSDPEPEGLTLLVPDIQRTAEIVRTATVSLKQASQGMQTCFDWANDPLAPVLYRVLAGKEIPIPASALLQPSSVLRRQDSQLQHDSSHF